MSVDSGDGSPSTGHGHGVLVSMAARVTHPDDGQTYFSVGLMRLCDAVALSDGDQQEGVFECRS